MHKSADYTDYMDLRVICGIRVLIKFLNTNGTDLLKVFIGLTNSAPQIPLLKQGHFFAGDSAYL